MDLRRLQHLVALADERHFGRAAQRVHLSQSAFSRSIQALESMAGQRLFDRDAAEVCPTPAGTFLIERARRLLFEARGLARDMALFSGLALGDTAVGAGPIPAATILPRVLAELRGTHPEVQVRIEVNNWRQLLERLRGEALEFFVSDVRDLPADPMLAVMPIGRQAGGFFVRQGHPLPDRPCTLPDLWRYGVATTALPPAISGALARLLGLAAGQRPPLALECDDVALLRGVTLATDTVLGTTEAAVDRDLREGQMRALVVEGLPPLFNDMGVVSLRNRSLSPLAQLLVTSISRVAAESTP